MIEQIYFSKKNRKYYSVNAICDKCSKQIELNAVYINSWHKKYKNCRFEVLCVDCASSPKNIINDGFGQETKIIAIRSIVEIPKDAVPVFINPLQLKDAKISTYDIDSLDSDTTIDKTKYANRESWGGASIGADINDQIEYLDSSSLDVDKFLLDLKDSKPIQPKQLENKGADKQ